MKTAFLCVLLCIAAVLLGGRQRSRIIDLEQRLAGTKTAARTEDRIDVGRSDDDYRGRYRERNGTETASEAYQRIVSLVETGRSVTFGPGVVMVNREAFRAVRQLDLKGQEELIRIIARSGNPKLNHKNSPIYKWEQINVCLCAMADHHPEVVLDYVRNSNERIGEFYQDFAQSNAMIHYAVRRLCERNVAAGLEALVEEATIPSDPTTSTGSGPSTPRIDGPQAAETLAAVAEHDADLALETIPRLPVAARVDPLRQLLALTDSNEECTRRFQLLRHRFPDDAKSLETTLQTLLANVSKRNPSWRGNADWLEALELTDDEKVRAAGALTGMGGDQGVHGMPEPTKWLADFLPPSKERDFILWSNASRGIWMAMDPDGAKAFLQQNSIDEEEMKRLESEGFLRPY